MNRASDFEWHKIFKKGRESLRDDGRCGWSKEVNTPQLIGQRVRVRVYCWGFKGVQKEIPSEEAGNLQIGLVAFPPGQCTSLQLIFVTDYLSKMGITTVPQFSLLPVTFAYFLGSDAIVMRKLKKTVTKVIDTLTQDDFHGAFQKSLERYNNCIAAGGDYFEGD